MNWKNIQKEYPKAYELYINWNCAKNPNCPSKECYEHNLRDLYDFFDENGIFITINGVVRLWVLDIIEQDGSCLMNNKIYNSRSEAEKAAFTKAFEILNEKL